MDQQSPPQSQPQPHHQSQPPGAPVPPSVNVAPSTVERPSMQQSITRRAPWVPDHHFSQCMVCAANFGLVCRRHHCRSCGSLVCHDCSKNTSKEVPGYEESDVRICKSCFVQFYAVLVVWHSWFSYKNKLVSGVDAGKKIFDKLPLSASRIALRMADGCVIDSWFKNEVWQNRIINRTQSHRREMLAPTSRSAAISARSSLASGPMPSSPMPSQVIPSSPPPTPSTNAVVPPATTTDAPPPQEQRVPPASPPARVAGPQQHSPVSTFLNCFIVYRHKGTAEEDGTPVFGPLIHAWIDVPSEPEFGDVLTHVTNIVSKSSIYECAVLNGSGTVLYSVDPVGHFVQLATQALKNCPVSLAWQSMEGPQMTRIACFGDMPALVGRMDNRLPLVALDTETGDVLMWRNCSASTLDVLSRTAGTAFGHLVAVTTLADKRVRLFNNSFLAHREIRDSEEAILFVCLASQEPRIAAAHPAVDSIAATVALLPSIRSALDTTAPERISRPTVVDEETRQETMNCPICIEPFSVEERRPCICGSCGNTVCHSCYTSLRQCPYCRAEFKSKRPPTNVALLALLEQQLSSSPSPLNASGNNLTAAVAGEEEEDGEDVREPHSD